MMSKEERMIDIIDTMLLFGIHKFRKYDISTKEGKERLIDGFVKNVYLFDDYALIT